MELWATMALLGVCGVALAVTRALGRRDASGAMRVVARLPVEQRRSLVVVQVGSRQFLVGVGEGPMTMLAELQPGDLPALSPDATPPPARDVWTRAWRRVMGGRA